MSIAEATAASDGGGGEGPDRAPLSGTISAEGSTTVAAEDLGTENSTPAWTGGEGGGGTGGGTTSGFSTGFTGLLAEKGLSAGTSRFPTGLDATMTRCEKRH